MRSSFSPVSVRSASTLHRESAVDHDKARVLRRLARQYLLALPDTPDQVRFDVLSIYYEAQKAADIQLFRGAFDWR